MRAGGFPGNPGGLVVSIVKTAGGRAPAHQARGRGRSTWRPTERSRRCSDGTAGRRQRSAGGWTARSRRVSEYRRSGGIEPTRPRGGKGAPAGGTGGGKDGQHTEVGSRLHVTITDSRTGQDKPWGWRWPSPGFLDPRVRDGAERSHLSRSRMRQNPHVRICGGPGSATTLVYPTSLYQGCGAEGLRHRSVERLRSIEDDEQTAVGPQPAALQIGQQALTHGRVLR